MGAECKTHGGMLNSGCAECWAAAYARSEAEIARLTAALREAEAALAAERDRAESIRLALADTHKMAVALRERAEKAEAKVQHYEECAEAPLMKTVLARAEAAESRAERLAGALGEACQTVTGMGVDIRLERWRAALKEGT